MWIFSSISTPFWTHFCSSFGYTESLSLASSHGECDECFVYYRSLNYHRLRHTINKQKRLRVSSSDCCHVLDDAQFTKVAGFFVMLSRTLALLRSSVDSLGCVLCRWEEESTKRVASVYYTTSMSIVVSNTTLTAQFNIFQIGPTSRSCIAIFFSWVP